MDDVWLFCSSCNVVVDHLRKFVVDKHLEAASHKRNAVRKDGRKQQTLKTVINCKTVELSSRESLYLLFRNCFIFNQPLIICPRIALDTQKASTVQFTYLL